MKKVLLFVSFLILAFVWATPTQINAQDILDVAAVPPGNLNEVINGDTLAGGLRAHPDRIYRLTRGNVYQLTEPLKINGNLMMIATDGDARPPVLAPAILADNSSIDHFFNFIGEGAEVDLSDLYLLGVRADQTWLGWSDGMRLAADRISLKLRRVIFEAFSNVGLTASGQWTKMDVQDCVFRNLQHTGSWFGGQPMRGPGTIAMDTVKFINNTFFCNNSYIWDIRGYDKYSVFEHNTVVYGVVNPFLIRQASNIHMKNNVFYSVHAFGGNPTHVIDGWFLNYPDTAASSIFRVRGNDADSYWAKLWATTISGPEAFVNEAAGVTLDMFDPTMRVSDVQNNAYHYPQELWDFYDAYNDTTTIADSINVPVYGDAAGKRDLVRRIMVKPRWITDYAQWTLDSLFPAVGATSMYANNTDMDPGFNAEINAHLAQLTNYIWEISTGHIDDVTWHYYGSSGQLYPPQWPLPENLAYSNGAMQAAGTDGFALGDLNWFPDQKDQWITGVEKIGCRNSY